MKETGKRREYIAGAKSQIKLLKLLKHRVTCLLKTEYVERKLIQMPETKKPKSKVKKGEKATQNELGMSFDAEGKFQNINFNILVKYIIKKREIVVDENGNYYWYIKIIYKKVPNIW